jgi:hypothetical protein
MTLRVDPDSLARFAGLVRRAGEDARAGREHLIKYGHADDGGGPIYREFLDWHRKAVEQVETVLEQIGAVADASAEGVDATADYYRRTDQSSAASFDDNLPDWCVPGDALDDVLNKLVCPPVPFHDWRHARDRLTDPQVPSEPGPWTEHPLRWLESVSLGGTVISALTSIFGFDPIDWIVSQVLGSWEKLEECGLVLEQLAGLAEDVAINVQQGSRDLATVWSGHAADAAVTYFKDLATTVDGLKDPLNKLAQAHEQAAQASWQAGKAIEGYVSALIDDAIAVSVLLAAGAALIETGVGTLVLWGGAALYVAGMYEEYEAATKTIHALYNTILMLVAMIEEAIAGLTAPDIPKVTSDAYHHPALPAVPVK